MTEQMQQLTRMLEEAGLIKRHGGDWELTARAVRKVGERALDDIFGKLQKNTFGDHSIDRRGVVESHAGRLMVENVDGGCRFELALPTAQ